MTKLEVAGVLVPHPDEVFVGGQWVAGEAGQYAVVSPTTEHTVAEVANASGEQAEQAVRVAHDEGLTWANTPVAPAGGGHPTDVRLPRDASGGRCVHLWAAEAGMPVRYSKTLHRLGRSVRGNRQSRPLEWLPTAPSGPHGRGADPPRTCTRRRRRRYGLQRAARHDGHKGSSCSPGRVSGCRQGGTRVPADHAVGGRVRRDCRTPAGDSCHSLRRRGSRSEDGRRSAGDIVSLTGGRTAQDIINATRPRFARTVLELGGKSAALILPDADIDRALRTLTPGASGGTGQVCALLARILVPEARHDEIVEALRSGRATDRRRSAGP